ncbi:DEAD/DEAH box helicase [Nonomuraea dietziae]|uniref:DEAD/DEAH box helicase n=1 Tax=Nonomuraea dietziae TaxID=65515 RepID=UPI003CD05C5B
MRRSRPTSPWSTDAPLLQGEVGAGKTVVARCAPCCSRRRGGPAVLLAPTEVLAQQHHRCDHLDAGATWRGLAACSAHRGGSAHRLHGHGRAPLALLDAASAPRASSSAPTRAAAEHVQFADLGLVVVDEQHRFGVEQRDALREKVSGGASTRAGHDRHAHSAHGRHERPSAISRSRRCRSCPRARDRSPPTSFRRGEAPLSRTHV